MTASSRVRANTTEQSPFGPTTKKQRHSPDPPDGAATPDSIPCWGLKGRRRLGRSRTIGRSATEVKIFQPMDYRSSQKRQRQTAVTDDSPDFPVVAGTERLVVMLLYGSGGRLEECLYAFLFQFMTRTSASVHMRRQAQNCRCFSARL